jgi:hypothetical protein
MSKKKKKSQLDENNNVENVAELEHIPTMDYHLLVYEQKQKGFGP